MPLQQLHGPSFNACIECRHDNQNILIASECPKCHLLRHFTVHGYSCQKIHEGKCSYAGRRGVTIKPVQESEESSASLLKVRRFILENWKVLNSTTAQNNIISVTNSASERNDNYVLSEPQSRDVFLQTWGRSSNPAVSTYIERFISVLDVYGNEEGRYFIAVLLNNPETYQDARYMALLVFDVKAALWDPFDTEDKRHKKYHCTIL